MRENWKKVLGSAEHSQGAHNKTWRRELCRGARHREKMRRGAVDWADKCCGGCSARDFYSHRLCGGERHFYSHCASATNHTRIKSVSASQKCISPDEHSTLICSPESPTKLYLMICVPDRLTLVGIYKKPCARPENNWWCWRSQRREKNGFLWKKSDVCCSPTGLMSFYILSSTLWKTTEGGIPVKPWTILFAAASCIFSSAERNCLWLGDLNARDICIENDSLKNE